MKGELGEVICIHNIISGFCLGGLGEREDLRGEGEWGTSGNEPRVFLLWELRMRG